MWPKPPSTAMLVYPDGKLQEAGGLIFDDGSAANYGRFEDPGHPLYGFVRETGYCSGAALAVPRALFAQLGGFDPAFRPGYYEDTDLAMRVREAGLAVRFQPASVVVHHEGLSAGTDTTRGMCSKAAACTSVSARNCSSTSSVRSACVGGASAQPHIASSKGRKGLFSGWRSSQAARDSGGAETATDDTGVRWLRN